MLMNPSCNRLSLRQATRRVTQLCDQALAPLERTSSRCKAQAIHHEIGKELLDVPLTRCAPWADN
jgi:hypothetical protein